MDCPFQMRCISGIILLVDIGLDAFFAMFRKRMRRSQFCKEILLLVAFQFFEEIRLSLERNEQVKLSGYGNFDLRDKKQRPGRNPKTGEEIPIKARRVVTFRPGQKLKARVEDYAGNDE